MHNHHTNQVVQSTNGHGITKMTNPGTIKIQPIITTDTHRILRTRAAEFELTQGEVIDQWAILFERTPLNGRPR